MKLLIVPIVTVLGMLGGQKIKGLRRFGIPGTVSLITTYKLLKNRKKLTKNKKVTPLEYVLLLLAFILSMGYGENSWLMKVCKKDWIVRIVYGVILSIPFLILKLWIAPLLLAAAWSVRAGGFKIYKGYDFLWEDFIRYTTLGVCISLVI